MNPDGNRRASVADLMAAVSAGAFGWLSAHTLNFWIIAHSHQGVLSGAARHVHEVTAAATVVAGCLAMATLLAAVVVVVPRRARPPNRRRGHRLSTQAAAGLSTAAFLAADTIEHAILDMAGTPPAVLLFGACLHAVFGAGASLSWLRLIDHFTGLSWPCSHRSEPAVHRPRRQGLHRCRRHRLLWADALSSRGPP
jgi:MFS family permease